MDRWEYYQANRSMVPGVPECRQAPWKFPYTPDEFFEHWCKKIPCQKIEYPPHDTTAGVEIILAVDASAKLASTHGGGGLIYFPASKIGRCYRMNFWEDLGIHIDDGISWECETLNLLFSLCIFKQTLINRENIRILCDHEKVRNPKKDPIVQSIWKIIEYLKNEGATITNDHYGNYDLTPKTILDKKLVGVCDRISKGFPIPEFKDDYVIFKGNNFHEVKNNLNKKYRPFFSGKKM